MKNTLITATTLLCILLTFTTKPMNAQTYNKLSPEETRVITNKGTEAPFTGKYDDFKEQGTYLCKQCNAPLYRSSDKFEAHCGWPAFDDEIPGAVKRTVDADGRRTEITCAHCGAHLGHVFEGEQLTDKNTRHCVNSISLNFVKDSSTSPEIAIFAGGCFWGMEYHFNHLDGVQSCESGYIGGHVDHPSYEQVCAHKTGHAEAIRVVFDPSKVSFETLAKLFFEIHDPTQLDGQGPDLGDQYRSEIFYTNEQQKTISLQLIAQLEKQHLEVVTRLTPATTFWVAEDYHQNYYDRKGTQPYCHIYTKRFM